MTPESRFLQKHSERWSERSYLPSFFEDETYINEQHESLVQDLDPILGRLYPVDQWKLYEAAYYAKGPIVEVGRLGGKSTLCLAIGARDGSGQPVYSIEFADGHTHSVRKWLKKHGVQDQVTLIQGDSGVQLTRLPVPFDTVFIDGDHSYEGVQRDVAALSGRVVNGGVLMFHDFWHPANDKGKFGVKRAVEESQEPWEFRGHFGAIAMFEQTS